MLFNLWDYTPSYQSASDGMMIEDAIKSMEEGSADVSKQSHAESADGAARPGVCTEKSQYHAELL